MNGTTRPQRPRSSHWGLSLFWILALTAAMVAAGAPARGLDPLVQMDEPIAEIRHHAPVPYAVIRREPGQIRRLYSPGNVLFHPQDSTRSFTVQRIESGAVVIRENPSGLSRLLRAGDRVPGFPGLVFTGTVSLDHLRYQFRGVERIEQSEPVLLSLEGSRAVLEVQVPRMAARSAKTSLRSEEIPLPPGKRRKLDLELLEKVRVKQINAHTYELDATQVTPVYENIGQVLSDLWPTVSPNLSPNAGVSFQITSPVGEGVLDEGGLTLTNIRVAQLIGIEVGDTIIAINGNRVNSLLDLYLRVQEIVMFDPRNSEIRLDINRRGSRIAKVLRVR